MAEGLIRLTWDGEAACITMADPGAMNAVSPPMLDQFHAALDAVEAQARVLVVTGEGKGFCAGANLARLQSRMSDAPAAYDPGELLETGINPLLQRLRHLPLPWIAALNGPAVGVGCGFALGADLVLAARSAFFLFAFGRVGLAPDGGASYLLSRAIGRMRASELLLMGERLPAEKALQWGLVNRVFDDAEFPARVREIASAMAAGPTRSFALARAALWRGLEDDYETALGRERADQRIAGGTQDHREGVDAFRARQAPAFTGR